MFLLSSAAIVVRMPVPFEGVVIRCVFQAHGYDRCNIHHISEENSIGPSGALSFVGEVSIELVKVTNRALTR